MKIMRIKVLFILLLFPAVILPVMMQASEEEDRLALLSRMKIISRDSYDDYLSKVGNRMKKATMKNKFKNQNDQLGKADLFKKDTEDDNGMFWGLDELFSDSDDEDLGKINASEMVLASAKDKPEIMKVLKNNFN